MTKLRVRQIAEAQGLNMSQLQKLARVTMPSVRRYWYNTRDGSAGGAPLKEVDFAVLTAIAGALGVVPSDLIENPTSADDESSPLKYNSDTQISASGHAVPA
jgi:transcriptional regulator with XRE-family HTH domain